MKKLNIQYGKGLNEGRIPRCRSNMKLSGRAAVLRQLKSN